MEIHHLLQRQLKRLGITAEQVPELSQWKSFLEKVHRTYTDADQERYLIERSMEVSSRETNELNEKLERAQRIAHLGYWTYDKVSGVITWSNEMYVMFGVKLDQSIPTYDELIERIDPEDRNILNILLERAFATGENYELEAKIKTFQNEYRWCYFVGNPHKNADRSPITFISGIGMDITARKLAEFELHKLNQQLLSSARRAGMSEVATSILHNVGNILNSVNVSVGLIQKAIVDLDISSLFAVIQLMNEHIDDLKNFMTNDPKGKLLPEYMNEAKIHIAKQIADANHEIIRLTDNVKHIKNIVAMQGTLSGASGLMEEVSIADIINSAVEINAASMNKKDISLKIDCRESVVLITDKNKIMQILVNLIQNAKDALIFSSTHEPKMITVKMEKTQDEVHIVVEDNGIGIAKENLTKIFSFGFTTKQKGHGFGLHSSALLAKELGGSLHAESNGIGSGSRFILDLPLITEKERSTVDA